MSSPSTQMAGFQGAGQGFREQVGISGSESFPLLTLAVVGLYTEKQSSTRCISWAKVCSLLPCVPTQTCPCHSSSRSMLLPVNLAATAGPWQPHSFTCCPSPHPHPRHELLPSLVTQLRVLKEERRFAVYFGRHLHPFCYCRSHTKDKSLSVFL